MPLSHALITPSFRTDFDRCALLVETAERWVAPGPRHYLVVDRRDVELFRRLESKRTRILVVEDIVPGWIQRIPMVRRVWFSFRSLPIRNWILQQIVKLSMARVLTEEVLYFVDSDVFFCAPFDADSLVKAGKPPLFVETGQRGLMPHSDRWHTAAAHLLGLQPEPSYDTNFIGNMICWRRDNVLQLHRKLEEVAKKRWELAIAPLHHFSEYILYGLFATQVLADSGQWHDSLERTLCYWTLEPLDEAGLAKFRDGRAAHHSTVMISAKSRTPVEAIRRVFRPA